jgi:hypothetical protein
MPLHLDNITRLGLCIPLDVLNEEWAQNNHGQSLARLKERGGLSMCEAAAIVERRKWRAMSNKDALNVIREYLVTP